MIAVGEPDKLSIIGEELVVRHGEKVIVFRVSKSLRGRFAQLARGEYLPPFQGEAGRWWLADPCTMILENSMRRAQALEDEAEKAWKAKRRRELAELHQERATAERGKPRRRAW